MAKRASPRNLFYGDCLDILQSGQIGRESVDMIYLDPPFNSKAKYNVIFGRGEDRAQTEAFRDLWTWNAEDEDSYARVVPGADRKLAAAIEGFRQILGPTGMLSYLLYMGERLLLLRDVLKSGGSLYLHCDPTASHYLKILLDAVFNARYISNEIIWCFRGGGVPRRAFARKHNVIFFYSKGEARVFNPQYMEYSDASKKLVESRGGVSIDNTARDLERGAHMTDWWADINSLQTWSPERLGYDTQKPLALLERMIRASSNEGDVVLDPFCGCGTTVDAAENLGRRWIGVDISYLAIDLIQRRLADRYGKKLLEKIRISGIPTDLAGAEHMARRTLYNILGSEPQDLDSAWQMATRAGARGEKHGKNAGRFEFQRWACSLIDAVPNDREIGDDGVDGILLWPGREGAKPLRGAVQVKSGAIRPDDVRALGNQLNGAYEAAILIGLRDTSSDSIRRICARKGSWTHAWTGKRYPRLQVWSAEAHFQGKRPDMPQPIVPYTKAARAALGKQKPML